VAWSRLQRSVGDDGIPTYDELLDIIAIETDGMSGASLAGVSRAAASRALERAVNDFAGHVNADQSNVSGVEEEGNSISDCLVTKEDFEKAIEDVFESAKSSKYTEIQT
jgi:SpoVK/Ycf46/Vps4 family AAA+-type ATPase